MPTQDMYGDQLAPDVEFYLTGLERAERAERNSVIQRDGSILKVLADLGCDDDLGKVIKACELSVDVDQLKYVLEYGNLIGYEKLEVTHVITIPKPKLTIDQIARLKPKRGDSTQPGIPFFEKVEKADLKPATSSYTSFIEPRFRGYQEMPVSETASCLEIMAVVQGVTHLHQYARHFFDSDDKDHRAYVLAMKSIGRELYNAESKGFPKKTIDGLTISVDKLEMRLAKDLADKYVGVVDAIIEKGSDCEITTRHAMRLDDIVGDLREKGLPRVHGKLDITKLKMFENICESVNEYVGGGQ